MTSIGLPPLKFSDFLGGLVVVGNRSYGRCRVLYAEGEYRLFNETGCILALKGEAPQRLRRLSQSWVGSTDKGEIQIKQTCLACGGWWKIAMLNAADLWNLYEHTEEGESEH